MTNERLKELAEAAELTTGPWFAEDNHVFSKKDPYEPDSHDIATYCWGNAEAEFIAAANPATVLALLAEDARKDTVIAELEGRIAEALAVCDGIDVHQYETNSRSISAVYVALTARTDTGEAE